MNQNKVTFLSDDEALTISGNGVGCWISTGMALAYISLKWSMPLAISLLAMDFYCE